MNRPDGLKQRRRPTANSSNGASSQDGANDGQGAHSDKNSPHDSDGTSIKDLNLNPAHDEDSDKETRLTLMEEVLLLGLKDKEVCVSFFSLIYGWLLLLPLCMEGQHSNCQLSAVELPLIVEEVAGSNYFLCLLGFLLNNYMLFSFSV